MPNGMVPPGYRAVLLGSVASLEDLNIVAPLEESTVEGSLMLMRLDFPEYPSPEVLSELEARLKEAGVVPWPGYTGIVYAATVNPSIYLAWQKGIAWMPIIIGILVVALLPALLGAFIWLLLPEPVKDLINAVVTIGVMFLATGLMKQLMPGKESPKQVAERAE